MSNVWDSLERLGWIVARDETQVHLSVPGFGRVRLSRPSNYVQFGSLDMPPSLLKSLEKQFSDIRVDCFPWDQFDLVAELLINNVLGSHAAETLAAWTQLETELRQEPITEKTTLSKVRQFQDRLRALLLDIRGKCEISGVGESSLLVASHILPWSKCTKDGKERLDPENVLLLACNWDALFDKFYISFDPSSGKMVKSERIDDATLVKFGVPADWRESVSVPICSERRKKYLSWHKEHMIELDAEEKDC